MQSVGEKNTNLGSGTRIGTKKKELGCLGGRPRSHRGFLGGVLGGGKEKTRARPLTAGPDPIDIK